MGSKGSVNWDDEKTTTQVALQDNLKVNRESRMRYNYCSTSYIGITWLAISSIPPKSLATTTTTTSIIFSFIRPLIGPIYPLCAIPKCEYKVHHLFKS